VGATVFEWKMLALNLPGKISKARSGKSNGVSCFFSNGINSWVARDEMVVQSLKPIVKTMPKQLFHWQKYKPEYNKKQSE
jgi:hypothetical protein